MPWRERLRHWRTAVEAFLLGASLSWTAAPHFIRYRKETERVAGLILAAQLLGLPLMPPSAALRLLPHLAGNILSWRRASAFNEALDGADLRQLGH